MKVEATSSNILVYGPASRDHSFSNDY
jgi:hypothetical protein